MLKAYEEILRNGGTFPRTCRGRQPRATSVKPATNSPSSLPTALLLSNRAASQPAQLHTTAGTTAAATAAAAAAALSAATHTRGDAREDSALAAAAAAAAAAVSEAEVREAVFAQMHIPRTLEEVEVSRVERDIKKSFAGDSVSMKTSMSTSLS